MSDEYVPNLEDLIDVLPLKRASEVDPIPKIPDAPDIAPPVQKEDAVPESVEGLTLLKPSERPVKGQHFVVWGSVTFSDIRERPVKRIAVSEDEYAEKMRKEAEHLVAEGLKDPDPAEHLGVTGEPKHRADRAEKYARWRYKGFVCGEVASL